LHQPGWVMTRCAFFRVHAKLGVACAYAQHLRKKVACLLFLMVWFVKKVDDGIK
jgi:hypothetical protein